jgi:hypothetical protein
MRELAHQVLDTVIEWGDQGVLCPYICRALQYGKNIKIRQVYLVRLIGTGGPLFIAYSLSIHLAMVPRMYETKQYLLSKHVVPLSLFLLKNETKTELKKSSHSLLRELYNVSEGELLQPQIITMFGISEAQVKHIVQLPI